LQDSGATGFWHEAYMRRGGVEAVYVDMKERVGQAKFAPVVSARGPMFSARKRAGLGVKRRASERCRKSSFIGLPLWPNRADSRDAADCLGWNSPTLYEWRRNGNCR
jgi:hypothetical protein